LSFSYRLTKSAPSNRGAFCLGKNIFQTVMDAWARRRRHRNYKNKQFAIALLSKKVAFLPNLRAATHLLIKNAVSGHPCVLD
ncbi:MULTISPECIES: hypothetical protein, partial [unclassified Microcoleus]|uniref:hypothetical protein n=1 Tax=unclassified Microcoleus TaxID=2642155 RepID=UPI002FCED47E